MFAAWLVLSAIWTGLIGYQAWHDIPRDDWFSEPSANRLSESIDLILFNPVARAVALDSIVLALAPPLLVLACGSALIWAVRGAQRQRR